MRTPLSVGVVGLDSRGLGYANVLAELPQVELRWLCGDGAELRQHRLHRFAGVRLTADPVDLFDDESLDAVVVSGTCPALVWVALAADKHVLAAAPLAYGGREAHDLVLTAQKRGRALLVSEPLVAQPAAEKLKELVETGRLGDVYALYASRQGLPRPSPSADGVWTFGADELSLLLYLLDDEPIEVFAEAESYVDPAVVDVVFCHLRFATGISAHLHLSWLDPLRIRRLAAIGSKRMAVLDDLEPERKLTIFQQSADATIGEIRAPRIDPVDTARIECERLVAAARATGSDPSSRRAVTVVGVLESLNASIGRGRPAVAERFETPSRPHLNVVPLRALKR